MIFCVAIRNVTDNKLGTRDEEWCMWDERWHTRDEGWSTKDDGGMNVNKRESIKVTVVACNFISIIHWYALDR